MDGSVLRNSLPDLLYFFSSKMIKLQGVKTY